MQFPEQLGNAGEIRGAHGKNPGKAAANFAPLKLLRSNSSSKRSRRFAGVCIRPQSSVLITVSTFFVVFVIA
jgi:hypothetical protein